MNRDEQRGALRARHAHALAERHEAVVGARHGHAIFAALLELFGERLRELQHDRLFHLAAGRDRAGIGPAMARIDHDQRPAVVAGAWPLRRAWSPARGAACASSARVRMKLARSVATRSSTSRAGCPSTELEHEGLVDAHRPGRVDHDARAALHHEAVAERLDQPAPLLAGARRKLEGQLRQVDHDPIRIGEREGRDLDRAREVEHEARAPGIAAEPGIRGDRKEIGRNRRCRPCDRRALACAGRDKAQEQRQSWQRQTKECRAQRHD